MSKRRPPPMTDFALPIPGRVTAGRGTAGRGTAYSRLRGLQEEPLKIENRQVDVISGLKSEVFSQRDPIMDGASALATVSIDGREEAKLSESERAGLEDAALLRKFQEGDETAFYTLFERRHKEIYTHCYRMCGRDSEKANDAFQDTFIKVFSRKDLFTNATNGRAWLYRIATNTCLNQLRYDKRHPGEALNENLHSTDPSLQPDFATEQDSLRIALESAVAKLPIELREPFLLREMEDFSYEEAAEQVGITVAACRQRVYRAKQLLREYLEEIVSGNTSKKKKKWGRAS